MSERARVFIASSSEALDVMTALRRLLLQELNETVTIEPWTRTGTLSATYIESLEQSADAADFAILVLTPDDVTQSRTSNESSPRDNVVFELGLFMGRIGRERCYVVQDATAPLKLPSDLLGLSSAQFRRPADGNLKVALDGVSARLAERIGTLRPRSRLRPEAQAAQARREVFLRRAVGPWWERITVDGAHLISFVQIEPDGADDAVRFKAQTFDADGARVAYWSSVLARVDSEEGKILYHWQGWYSNDRQVKPQDRFHGFGEVEFDVPTNPAAPLQRAIGRFWDVDESHPERTRVKPLELRRVENAEEAAVLSMGKEREVRDVVERVMRDW